MSHESSLNGLEVAVIGMAGRFPSASNIKEFWKNLKNNMESISFFTDEELRAVGVKSELLENPLYVKTNGGVVDHSEYFDAEFFRYTPNEAEVMSPQTRVFHECCWEALEDAGYDPWSFPGTIGLYGGGRNSFDWQALSFLTEKTARLGEVLASTLYDKDNMTFRISYNFNLRGPSFSLNTACSTGLVAIHLACQGLLSGECDMALAGAAAISSLKKRGYLYQEGDIISPDGHLRAFDANAKGLVYSEGVGAVLLKTLEDASTDGDHIYAVIKGSAINNDGHNKVSYTAPAIKGQETVIRAALYMADIEPESIGYIETHGTGTPVGDPIEIQSLKQALNSSKKHFCAIGSVKTNVGHMTESAGIGGFIKTVLVLHHACIPATLHFEAPNLEIDFENSPVYVNTELKEWQNNGIPRRAGVSSFARGGTNAHIILEEWPIGPSSDARRTSPGAWREYQLILLSAHNPEALEQMTRNLADHFKETPGINLADAAYTLQVGRKILPHRRKLVCKDINSAVEILSSSQHREVRTYSANASQDEDRPVVFVFAGLGSQYINMGLDTYKTERIFREEMDRCFKILNSLVDYNIKEIIYPEAGNSQADIDHIEVAQLLIFIFEYALAKLLMEWGITPKAMIGYSFGEYIAACIAGVFSLEDALRLVVSRGRLIGQLPTGVMLSVPLTQEELLPLLQEEISIAINNGPSCIVAGTITAVSALEQQLKRKKYLCMPLASSHALHSQMMEPILEEFAKEVRKITLKKHQIPYISNITGQWLTDEEALDPDYWAAHLCETVQFAEGVTELVKEKGTLFVEIGPGRDISALITRYIDQSSQQQVINLVKPPGKEISDVKYLLNKVGDLWLLGKKINWSGFYQDEKRNRVPLPTYPFQRQHYTLVPPGMDWQGIFLKGLHRTDKAFTGNRLIDKSKEDPLPKYSQARPNLMNPYVSPRTQVEQTIAAIWQELLGFKEIGIEDDFLELGGDSLKAVTVMSRIHKEYNVVISLPEFFKTPTIKNLTQWINKGEEQAFLAIKPAEIKDRYVLSSAQKRLYILQQLGPGILSYNLPQVYILEGKVDKGKMQNIFRKLIKRHESLRISFEILAGEPVQKINEEVEFKIEYYESIGIKERGEEKHKEMDPFIDGFVKPFDLSLAPLFRIGLIKVQGDEYILMSDIHHTISDGVSNVVFMEEFIALYAEEKLPALTIQYKDYAEWQQGKEMRDAYKQQEEFWLREFEGEIPVLNLPTDYPRPRLQDLSGSEVTFQLYPEQINALKELARKEGSTLFMVFLAILNIFLSKLSGQEDVIVGTPIAGRRHADLQRIIGVFINTLTLRNFPWGKKTFKVFLSELKERSLAAFENQDYHFEDLVEKVVVKRDISRNPLFDVMFVYLNIFDALNPLSGQPMKKEAKGIKIRQYDYKNKTSKFDLTLTGKEVGEKLYFAFEYCTSLFKEETVTKFVRYLKKIISLVIENPGKEISAIEIITEEEKNLILYQWNDTHSEFPRTRLIQEFFEEQVEEKPDNTALLGSGEKIQITNYKQTRAPGANMEKYVEIQLTYRELNQKSNQLAVLLREKGIGPDSIVAILVERSVEMLIGILAILKTGGAYMPIVPNYPEERINYLLKDSGARVLVTTSILIESGEVARHRPLKLYQKDVSTVFINTFEEVRDNYANPPHQRRGTGKQKTGTEHPMSKLAYIIYTSGSTGKPKGVMVNHESVVNILFALHNQYPFEKSDVYLLKTSYIFDVSVAELFGWFLGGGKLAILEKDGEKDPYKILNTIQRIHVTHINFVPSMFNAFVGLLTPRNVMQISGLKYIILAGEALFPQLVNQFRQLDTKILLENIYGPTEGTVYSSKYSLSQWNCKGSIPIGKPLPNIELHILDGSGHLQPIGVLGELCISGLGVTRGYLNRPQLTAERFFSISSQSSRSFDAYIPGKIYRTGDLARWLPDGNIEYLGRIDHQVKVRGFRVEMGEVEACLTGYEAIKEAVVMVNEPAAGETSSPGSCEKEIYAYIVSKKELTVMELRNYLKTKLPEYMIPSYFVSLEHIPLTVSGKVDRKALGIQGARLSTGVEFIPPENKIEKLIAVIWQEVLKRDKIGIHDNFFEIGGNSLKIIQINSKLKESFEINIPFTIMFEYTTIASLSQYFQQEGVSEVFPETETDRGEEINKGRDRLRQRMQRRGVNQNVKN